jgi:cell fate (sporulation/competence/biofilm development) regulator YlbF (YheA/YmcA/DUF963 family)
METTAVPTSPLDEKIRELCQAILERPDFVDLRRRIDAFMADEKVKYEYQMLNDTGAMLQQKQQQGMEITEEEIGRFEALRESFTKNPVATEFMVAQQEVSRVQDNILKHVQKTLELGRVPTVDDMNDGSCCNSHGGCCS